MKTGPEGLPSRTPDDLDPSRCDRVIDAGRKTFLRDWLLALFALALVLGASTLRHHPQPTSRSHTDAASTPG